MNRAWIPAGALASVSVAGLIALGPLTDSLHTPVSFPSVVTVSAPTPKSTAVAVSFPAVVVGQTTHASLARGGASTTDTNTSTGQVSVTAKKAATVHAQSPAPRATTPPPAPTPVKKKVKRPSSIGGSTGSNGDVGLASGNKGGRSSVGEQSSQLGSDSNP